MNDYYGYPVHNLSSPLLSVDCLATAGPRIVRLRYKGSDNLLAEVPDIIIPTEYGDYSYLGGHRLWYAPEAMPRSYIPDSCGMTLLEIPDGIVLEGKTELSTGIRKKIEIRVDPNRPSLVLNHILINDGLWEIELAPWAITMFRLGGIAIMPIRIDEVDNARLLPDRNISLWAYSKINDLRLKLNDQYILVSGKHTLPSFKIGAYNPCGWIGYWLDGILFVKRFTVFSSVLYPDNNCNSEIYCDEHFIELESFGPLKKLAPGESVEYIETWELFDSIEEEFIPGALGELLKQE